MTETVHLNALDVARAAAEAYREGRLSAQNGGQLCAYRDASGCPCVIGAALDDETATNWDQFDSSSVDALHEKGLLTSDDVETLRELQIAHDDWLRGDLSAEKLLRDILNDILPTAEWLS